jgi:hypothetical protein
MLSLDECRNALMTDGKDDFRVLNVNPADDMPAPLSTVQDFT